MTTHTDLIARLRAYPTRDGVEAADAIESLEQRVAEKDMELAANLQERVRMQAVINAFENWDRASKYAPDTPEIAALRVDAERYRWLRDGKSFSHGIFIYLYVPDLDTNIREYAPHETDAAIDAARNAKSDRA